MLLVTLRRTARAAAPALLAATFTVSLTAPLFAATTQPAPPATPVSEDETDNPGVDPISEALLAADEDVRIYNDHVVTLASPFMEGRVPGSAGMEHAKDYMQYYLERAGLEPAFPGEDGPFSSWRQRFELGATPVVHSQSMRLSEHVFDGGVDFQALGLGTAGAVAAPVVFVGYSIEDGPDGYETYPDGMDLTGKVALMLRFEPMDAEGKSRFGGRPWSNKASFNAKLRALRDKNPAAVLVVNTPGAADTRSATLMSAGAGGNKTLDVPVVHVSTEAGIALVEALSVDGPSLLELREAADEGLLGVLDLGGTLSLEVDLERIPLPAENVAGVLAGKGALAHEFLVIGAHLDHLGMGEFGSRSGPGELHPGADDNASGSAAVLMLADKIAADYAEMPEGTDARSILFMGFSAEESGLNGARHYVNNPVAPIEDHALMINFDMIGRIKNKRLSVSGLASGDGLKPWIQGYFAASPLDIVQSDNMNGASDHAAFFSKQVPVLFGIIADFHDDYHTPRDVSSLINRVDAVHTVDLFHQIGLGLATEPARFEFMTRERALANNDPPPPADPARGGIKVRFGVSPGNYDEEGNGILVSGVTPGGSAAEAGIQDGDRLLRWNGDPIESVLAWMGMLGEHEPGDTVTVGVIRDGAAVDVDVVLQSRPQEG